MLALARDKLSGREDLRNGYADSLPWSAASFDVVVSCNMFHYISHPVKALREMARVLRPGGSIVLTELVRRLSGVPSMQRAGSGTVKLERYKISWLWGLMTAVIRY